MNQDLPIDLVRLKRIIMRRVYAIWLYRSLARSVSLKFALLTLLLFWQIGWYVSPIAVWRNAVTAGGFAHYGFFLTALTQTETAVQLSLVVGLAIFLWLAKDLLTRGARLVNLSSRP